MDEDRLKEIKYRPYSTMINEIVGEFLKDKDWLIAELEKCRAENAEYNALVDRLEKVGAEIVEWQKKENEAWAEAEKYEKYRCLLKDKEDNNAILEMQYLLYSKSRG